MTENGKKSVDLLAMFTLSEYDDKQIEVSFVKRPYVSKTGENKVWEGYVLRYTSSKWLESEGGKLVKNTYIDFTPEQFRGFVSSLSELV